MDEGTSDYHELLEKVITVIQSKSRADLIEKTREFKQKADSIENTMCVVGGIPGRTSAGEDSRHLELIYSYAPYHHTVTMPVTVKEYESTQPYSYYIQHHTQIQNKDIRRRMFSTEEMFHLKLYFNGIVLACNSGEVGSFWCMKPQILVGEDQHGILELFFNENRGNSRYSLYLRFRGMSQEDVGMMGHRHGMTVSTNYDTGTTSRLVIIPSFVESLGVEIVGINEYVDYEISPGTTALRAVERSQRRRPSRPFTGLRLDEKLSQNMHGLSAFLHAVVADEKESQIDRRFFIKYQLAHSRLSCMCHTICIFAPGSCEYVAVGICGEEYSSSCESFPACIAPCVHSNHPIDPEELLRAEICITGMPVATILNGRFCAEHAGTYDAATMSMSIALIVNDDKIPEKAAYAVEFHISEISEESYNELIHSSRVPPLVKMIHILRYSRSSSLNVSKFWVIDKTNDGSFRLMKRPFVLFGESDLNWKPPTARPRDIGAFGVHNISIGEGESDSANDWFNRIIETV